MEQKGEEIHKELNEISRKTWVIKNAEQRLWTLVRRYEMRNQTKCDIVKPTKRKFVNLTK